MKLLKAQLHFLAKFYDSVLFPTWRFYLKPYFYADFEGIIFFHHVKA